MSLIDADTGEVVDVDRQVMPDLEEEIRAGLRESILRFGVMVPILCDQHGGIIDGHNRWEIAGELGVTCPSTSVHVESEEEALERAAALNLRRRHMTPEARRTMAAPLRAKGFSQRAIAAVLGVSQSQVRRDLGEDDTPQVSRDGSPGGSAEDEEDTSKVSRDGSPGGSAEDEEDTSKVSRDGSPSKQHSSTTGVDGKTYRRGPWSSDELLALLDAVECGASHSEVAEVHDISRSNLAHLLTRARKLRRGDLTTCDDRRMSESNRSQQIADLAAQGLTSRQIADRLNLNTTYLRELARRIGVDIPADKVVGRTRRIDSSRVVAETSYALEGLAQGIGLVDTDDLDLDQIEQWVISISDSLRALTRFNKQLKEMTP